MGRTPIRSIVVATIESAAEIHTGHCLCGGVQYEIRGPLEPVTACHCSQCRRTSGHHVAMTSVPKAALKLASADTLRWYRSSEAAERGFCDHCGGNLFWRAVAGDTISVTAGTLDSPTGLTLDKHIYVVDKGDYYVINDTAVQFPGTG
jgi:hypothetical protein